MRKLALRMLVILCLFPDFSQVSFTRTANAMPFFSKKPTHNIGTGENSNSSELGITQSNENKKERKKKLKAARELKKAQKKGPFGWLFKSFAFYAGVSFGLGSSIAAYPVLKEAYLENPFDFWLPVAHLFNPDLMLPTFPDDPKELYKVEGSITYIAKQKDKQGNTKHWTVGDGTYYWEGGKQVYYAGLKSTETIRSEKFERFSKLHLIAEDRKFFYDPHRGEGHKGIDELALIRATIQYLKGGNLQGGSTITMQVVLNLYEEEMTRSQTIPRKLTQMVYALWMELNYEKREIFDLYLNNVSYTDRSRGAWFGALENYNKSIEELTDFEMLQMIASLRGPKLDVNGPMTLGNYRDILIYANLALEYDIFTPEEYQVVKAQVDEEVAMVEAAIAQGEEVEFQPKYTKPQGVRVLDRVPLVNTANQELIQMGALSPEIESLLETGHGKIYLSYDRTLQKRLTPILGRAVRRMGGSDGAFVAVDRNGKVVAYISYDRSGEVFDHANNPKGIASVSKLFTGIEGLDNDVSFWTREWGGLASNFLASNSKYFLRIGARRGLSEVFQTIVDLDVPILDYNPKWSGGYVGGGSIEISPLYMAALMRLFYDGKYLPPHFIERIENTDDPIDELAKWLDLPDLYNNPKAVYSKQDAQKIYKLMCQNVYSGAGTATKAQSALVQFCAKTGTLSKGPIHYRVTCGGIAGKGDIFFYGTVGHPNHKKGSVWGLNGGKAYGADACVVSKNLIEQIYRYGR